MKTETKTKPKTKKNLKQSNQPPKRTRKRRTNKTIAEENKDQQGNKIEFKKKTLKKIIKTKNSFFERINKLLARLNKKRERVQIGKIRNKRINNNQCHRNAKKTNKQTTKH